MNSATTVTDELINAVEEAAGAAERTVLRRLLGLPVRGRVRTRVDAELERRGLRPMAQLPGHAPSLPPEAA